MGDPKSLSESGVSSRDRTTPQSLARTADRVSPPRLAPAAPHHPAQRWKRSSAAGDVRRVLKQLLSEPALPRQAEGSERARLPRGLATCCSEALDRLSPWYEQKGQQTACFGAKRRFDDLGRLGSCRMRKPLLPARFKRDSAKFSRAHHLCVSDGLVWRSAVKLSASPPGRRGVGRCIAEVCVHSARVFAAECLIYAPHPSSHLRRRQPSFLPSSEPPPRPSTAPSPCPSLLPSSSPTDPNS